MWARVTKTYFEELKVSIKTTEPILKNSKFGFIGEIFTSLPCQICQIAQNVYKNSSKVVKQNMLLLKRPIRCHIKQRYRQSNSRQIILPNVRKVIFSVKKLFQ